MTLALETSDLSVSFGAGNARVEALRGLNLAVEQGEVFGFIGPNGAGKTTAMHVLLGFLAQTGGMARIYGTESQKSVARSRLGYLPEHPETYRFMTGRELLMMAGRLFGMGGRELRRRAGELLATCGLGNAGDRRIAVYSRGMLQRIGLAQALINNPDLLILDEPTGGLDPLGRMWVRDLIARLKNEGKTVFFSSHELSEVELVCDRVGILSGGRLIREGKPAELAGPDQSLERYFLSVVNE